MVNSFLLLYNILNKRVMMKIQWEKLQIKKEETTMDNGINDHYLYISNVIKGLIIFKLRINTPNEIFKEYLRKPSYNRDLCLL